jgi:hypothetical protein
MRINRFEEVIGVMTQAQVVEGRFGYICRNMADSYDYGSRSDLPGWAVPASADQAEQACFVITWAVDNRKPPLFVSHPDVQPSFRFGWDKDANLPASVTLYTTYPGYQDGVTIPSGTPALAYGLGTYTIPSGGYIENASLHFAGAFVTVANTAEDTTDAGKPKYAATNDDRVIGIVEHYDSSNGDLTIRIRK